MAEHDHPDNDLDPEMQRLLRDLDYADAGPPSDLRARTLHAVRERPVPARRRARRPAIVGGAIGIAAAALVALLVVLGGGDGDPGRTVTLEGSAGALRAAVRDGKVALTGDPAKLRSGERYELWAVQGDPDDPTLTSAGTFRPGTDGAVDAELELPAGAPDDVSLAVTREADDDPAPNLPPVLAPTPA